MRRIVLLISLALYAAAAAAQDADFVAGSKKFTESVILAEVLRQSVEAGGVASRHRAELGGTRFLWEALLRGDIDAYPEYTGTLVEEIFAGENLSADDLRRRMAGLGIQMSRTIGFNNTYALGMRRDRAEALEIRTISDLRDHPDLRLGFSNEFMDRSDGWPGLRSHYRLPQQTPRGIDHDLSYRGIASGTIDVTDVYTTDAEIDAYDLVVLEDDRRYFPRYDAVILVRSDVLERHGAVRDAVEQLAGRVDEETMRRMNREARLEGIPEPVVAARFLEQALGVRSDIDRSSSRLDRLVQTTRQHLFLVAVSLVSAIVLAIPLGVVAARYERFGQFILGAVGVIYTIPSLALLVFMIPLLGIGARPAILALFLYSLLPIVRNTHSGLVDIPRPMRESAIALGLPSRARLRLIELPLAVRSITAGIKTAAVINVGTATLGALIGAGGYGQPILTGIRLDNTGLILEGAVPAAALALLVQGVFELAERLLVPRGLR